MSWTILHGSTHKVSLQLNREKTWMMHEMIVDLSPPFLLQEAAGYHN